MPFVSLPIVGCLGIIVAIVLLMKRSGDESDEDVEQKASRGSDTEAPDREAVEEDQSEGSQREKTSSDENVQDVEQKTSGSSESETQDSDAVTTEQSQGWTESSQDEKKSGNQSDQDTEQKTSENGDSVAASTDLSEGWSESSLEGMRSTDDDDDDDDGKQSASEGGESKAEDSAKVQSEVTKETERHLHPLDLGLVPRTWIRPRATASGRPPTQSLPLPRAPFDPRLRQLLMTGLPFKRGEPRPGPSNISAITSQSREQQQQPELILRPRPISQEELQEPRRIPGEKQPMSGKRLPRKRGSKTDPKVYFPPWRPTTLSQDEQQSGPSQEHAGSNVQGREQQQAFPPGLSERSDNVPQKEAGSQSLLAALLLQQDDSPLGPRYELQRREQQQELPPGPSNRSDETPPTKSDDQGQEQRSTGRPDETSPTKTSIEGQERQQEPGPSERIDETRSTKNDQSQEQQLEVPPAPSDRPDATPRVRTDDQGQEQQQEVLSDPREESDENTRRVRKPDDKEWPGKYPPKRPKGDTE